MKIVCPNQNLPEWKRLVDVVGEDCAYLVFFRNNYEIPDVAISVGWAKIGETLRPDFHDEKRILELDETTAQGDQESATSSASTKILKSILTIINQEAA